MTFSRNNFLYLLSNTIIESQSNLNKYGFFDIEASCNIATVFAFLFIFLNNGNSLFNRIDVGFSTTNTS